MDGWMGGWMDGWVDGWVGGWMDGWMDRWLGEYCFKDVKGYLSPNNDENEGVDTPTYVSTTCVSTTTTYVRMWTHTQCTYKTFCVVVKST